MTTMDDLLRAAQSAKTAELAAETVRHARVIAAKYEGTTEDDFDMVKLVSLLVGVCSMQAITLSGIELDLREMRTLLERFAPPTRSGT